MSPIPGTSGHHIKRLEPSACCTGKGLYKQKATISHELYDPRGHIKQLARREGHAVS